MDKKNGIDHIDALLSKAVNDSFDREMASVPSAEELAKMYPYSRRSLKRAKRRLDAKRRGAAVAKHLKRVAVIFVAISALSITAFLTGNAMKHQGSVSLPETRQTESYAPATEETRSTGEAFPLETSIPQVVTEEPMITEPYTTVPPAMESPSTETAIVLPPTASADIPFARYIPTGYELSEQTGERYYDMSIYLNRYTNKHESFSITVVHNPAPKSTPSGLVTEWIKINGVSAILTYDYTEGIISINYCIDNSSGYFEVTIKGLLDSKDELILVAESIK